MKKRMILATVIVLVPLISLWAQSESDFEVLQNRDNTLTITGYNGGATDVVIPETLFGLKVTAISGSAFWRKGLTSVILPNTLITIGDLAFGNATNLSGFGLTSDGRGANQFTEIVIPNSVTHIGNDTFRGGDNFRGGVLTKITLGSGVRSIGERAFTYNKLKEVELPVSLTSVASHAFSNNEIEKVSFGTATESIGNEAFRNNKLTELILPASLKTIGKETFNNNKLQNVTIPNGVIIEERAFANNQLQSVIISNGVTIRSDVFVNNPLSVLTIPVLISINSRSFRNLPLTHITIPANLSDDFFSFSELETSFRNFYISQNRAAGTYIKNGPIWTLSVVPQTSELVSGNNSFTYTGRTVRIGNLKWMAQNLNFETGNSLCYDNNSNNCSKYGRLYDWNTAMRVCPSGWRLPTDADWNNLVQAAGGKEAASKKLKSKSGWDICPGNVTLVDGNIAFGTRKCNGNGTDDFGFSALPGGRRNSGGIVGFMDGGSWGHWWSATDGGSDRVHRWDMNGSENKVYLFDVAGKDSKASVRCVQDIRH